MLNKKPNSALYHVMRVPLHMYCALTPLLLAQSAIALGNTTETVDEVIVTATKRDQLLKDFSGSATVVQGDALNPLATISDIANQVPGLTATNIGPRNTTAITLRGLRTDQLGSRDYDGDGSTVATYIDNIPLQGFFAPPAIGLKDLQQIEVLRGPQGTLYGNASVGGLIRYVTAKPDLTKTTATISTSISQTAESNDLNYDTDLVVNAPLIDNTLGARLLLSKQHNAGFIDNSYLIGGKQNDTNSDETQQGRVSILWKPVDEFSLAGSYSYQKINADDRQAVNEEISGNKFGATSKYLQPLQGVLQLTSVDADYDFGFAKLTASVNRADYAHKSIADQTDYLLYSYGEDYYADYDKFSAFTNARINTTKNSGELRLVSPSDQSFRWLVGAFVSNDDLDVMLADHVPGFAAVFNENRPDDLDYLSTQTEGLREQSIYTELAYDIVPEWEVAVGARHFRFKDKVETCSLFFPLPDDFMGTDYPLSCNNANDDRSGTLGKFSTKYKFNNEQNIYFTVAQGFRRGGANLLPAEITVNRTYKPDQVINYELGTHSNFLNGKIQFNGSLFYMDWHDVQVQSLSDDGYKITENAAAARTQGVELEATTQLNQTWSLHVSYAFTDAALTKSSTFMSNEYDVLTASTGDRLPGSPKQQWNLGLNYQHMINTANLMAGINYSYASDITTALNKTFADYSRLNGYSTVNAHIDVSLCNMKFGVFVNNMANTYAVTGRRTTTFYGDVGQFDYITRPRTIGLKASYQF